MFIAKKLRKNICPKLNCGGFLKHIINHEDEEVMECTECGLSIDKGDYDIILLRLPKDDKIIDEIEKNLSGLNNL